MRGLAGAENAESLVVNSIRKTIDTGSLRL